MALGEQIELSRHADWQIAVRIARNTDEKCWIAWAARTGHLGDGPMSVEPQDQAVHFRLGNSAASAVAELMKVIAK